MKRYYVNKDKNILLHMENLPLLILQISDKAGDTIGCNTFLSFSALSEDKWGRVQHEQLKEREI